MLVCLVAQCWGEANVLEGSVRVVGELAVVLGRPFIIQVQSRPHARSSGFGRCSALSRTCYLTRTVLSHSRRAYTVPIALSPTRLRCSRTSSWDVRTTRRG